MTAQATTADLLADLEAEKARAVQIVGIVSDTALIGEASKRANADRWASRVWSVIAVLLGISAVLYAVLAADAHDPTADQDWSGIALHALIVLSIGGVATFAARQASEHRSAQRDHEHMAIRLAAIKPFLRDMEEGDSSRNRVLEDVAQKLFAARTSPEGGSGADALPPSTMQLFQLIIDAAARAK